MEMKTSTSNMNARGQEHLVTLAKAILVKKIIKIGRPYHFFQKQQGYMKRYFIWSQYGIE